MMLIYGTDRYKGMLKRTLTTHEEFEDPSPYDDSEFVKNFTYDQTHLTIAFFPYYRDPIIPILYEEWSQYFEF